MSKFICWATLLTCLFALGCEPVTVPPPADPDCEVNAELQTKLDFCLDSVEGKKQEISAICEGLEAESGQDLWAERLTVSLDEGGALEPSLCSPEDLLFSLRKVDTGKSYAWLKYRTKAEGAEDFGQVKYSDILVYSGVKADRSSLLISNEIGSPVLLQIEACSEESCEVSCLQMRTKPLTCNDLP